MRDFSGFPKHSVITLHELLGGLHLRFGSNPSPPADARVLKSIQNAIQALSGKHNWTYYRRQTRFTTSPQVSMKFFFDQTGGAQERLASIVGGSYWPQDATYGELVIGEVKYRVEKRISAMQATLEKDFSLARDMTCCATWQRPSYQFTREIAKVHYVRNITANRQLTTMAPNEFEAMGHRPYTSGMTRHFSWQNRGNVFGGSEFVLHPAPICAEIVEVSASVIPHKPTVVSISGVDATGGQGTYDLICPSATFNHRAVGCVVRLSSTAALPGDDWTYQGFVVGANGSTLKLSEPLPSNYSSVGYLLSSPIDIEASVMLESLEDECFYQYTKNHDHVKLRDASQIAAKSLREAMTRDNKAGVDNYDGHYGWYDPFRFHGGYINVCCNNCASNSCSCSGSGIGGGGASEATNYLDALPNNAVGNNGDQVYIRSGDLDGAIYEKLTGVWTFQGNFKRAIRTASPNLAVLPIGFQWDLVQQASIADNGAWEWDGFNIYQRAAY